MELPRYVSVPKRKRPDRSVKKEALQLDVKSMLSKYLQPSSEILVDDGLSVVLAQGTLRVRCLLTEIRGVLRGSEVGMAVTDFVRGVKMKLIVEFLHWLIRTYGLCWATP